MKEKDKIYLKLIDDLCEISEDKYQCIYQNMKKCDILLESVIAELDHFEQEVVYIKYKYDSNRKTSRIFQNRGRGY